MRRLVGMLLLLALAAPAATAAPAPTSRHVVIDGTVTARALSARVAAKEWGGPTVATNGEIVNVLISDSVPRDPALAKQWADFMTSLVHGSELSTVTIHLMQPAEVARYCGAGALACY